MRLEPRSISDAIELGYHAGNLHWRVRFQGEVLFVALEGRPEDYTARLGEMISARRVGVSILDEEERDGGSGEHGTQPGDSPVAAKDHFHHDGHS
jgi:urease accessory protein